MNEIIKKINEWAYQAGRSYQSAETGFLHLSYHLQEDQVAHSIPIVENLLFALALLRIKTQESVLEAKDLIEKILHFQNADGNFPIYIHEYPICHNHFLGADILPIFHWILQGFSQVLGETLKQRIQRASGKLLQFNLEMLKNHNPSTIVKLKILAADGIKTTSDDEIFWHIPEQLGEALIAMQMVDCIPKDKLLSGWHKNLNCYTGPAIKIFQKESKKELTLYDLYMAAVTQQLPECPTKLHFSLLKGALVQNEESFTCETNYPELQEKKFLDAHYSIFKQKNFSYSIIEPKEKFLSKGFHPFYFTWGKDNLISSFVMQGGNIESISYEKHLSSIDLFIDLKSDFDIDEREASKEISFYTEVNEESELVVDNKKATTFLMDQKVSLKHPFMNLDLQFSVEKGDGTFRGHIMRSNRPSQKHYSIKDRFNAYDWQISLRTLKRSTPCRIKVTFRYEELFKASR